MGPEYEHSCLVIWLYMRVWANSLLYATIYAHHFAFIVWEDVFVNYAEYCWVNIFYVYFNYFTFPRISLMPLEQTAWSGYVTIVISYK